MILGILKVIFKYFFSNGTSAQIAHFHENDPHTELNVIAKFSVSILQLDQTFQHLRTDIVWLLNLEIIQKSHVTPFNILDMNYMSSSVLKIWFRIWSITEQSILNILREKYKATKTVYTQHIRRHMSLGFTATLQHWKSQYKETKAKLHLRRIIHSHILNLVPAKRITECNISPDYCIDLSAWWFSWATVLYGENIWTGEIFDDNCSDIFVKYTAWLIYWLLWR